MSFIHGTRNFSQSVVTEPEVTEEQWRERKEEYEICSTCPYPAESAPCGCCPRMGDVATTQSSKWELFMFLYGQGLTDQEIADHMKVSVRMVQMRRSKRKLKKQYKSIPDHENPCEKCQDITKTVCRRMHGICNERVIWEQEMKKDGKFIKRTRDVG